MCIYKGIPISAVLSLILLNTGNSNLIFNIKNHYSELMLSIFYTCLIGCMGCFNQSILMLSLKYEEAFKISLIKTTDMLFVFVLQYFLLGIQTNTNNLIGVFLIGSSTLIIFTFKYFNDKYTLSLAKASKQLSLAPPNTNSIDLNQNKLRKTSLVKKIIFIQF